FIPFRAGRNSKLSPAPIKNQKPKFGNPFRFPAHGNPRKPAESKFLKPTAPSSHHPAALRSLSAAGTTTACRPPGHARLSRLLRLLRQPPGLLCHPPAPLGLPDLSPLPECSSHPNLLNPRSMSAILSSIRIDSATPPQRADVPFVRVAGLTFISAN